MFSNFLRACLMVFFEFRILWVDENRSLAIFRAFFKMEAFSSEYFFALLLQLGVLFPLIFESSGHR